MSESIISIVWVVLVLGSSLVLANRINRYKEIVRLYDERIKKSESIPDVFEEIKKMSIDGYVTEVKQQVHPFRGTSVSIHLCKPRDVKLGEIGLILVTK